MKGKTRLLGKRIIAFIFILFVCNCPGLVLAEGIDYYTKLMIQSDSIAGDTIVLDRSPSDHAVDAFGNTHHSTAKAKFGSTSLYFDGSEDYISIPDSDDWFFGEDDFTIDFWFNTTSTCRIMAFTQGTGGSHSNNNQSAIIDLLSNELIFGYRGTVAGTHLYRRSSNLPALRDGLWHHVALVRFGNSLDLYIDGNSIGTIDMSDDPILCNSPYQVTIGKYSESFNGVYYLGYMDEYRISKGVARWEGNFTPPDEPYTDVIPNSPPLADAGEDQFVLDEVILDGSASYDSDGTIMSYEWQLDHRTNSDYNRTATGISPIVSNLEQGIYDVTLTVTDDDGETAFDAMVLSALDGDEDGVPDGEDLCPDTPSGILVNSQGCPVEADPVFESSPAFTITQSDIDNWNTEDDPAFTASPASGISAEDIVRWNSAETDPVFMASIAASITSSDIVSWNAGEVDPVFGSSPASIITNTDIDNWNSLEEDPVFSNSAAFSITLSDITSWNTPVPGPEGPQGPQGEVGPQGPQGIQGPPGADGQDVPNALSQAGKIPKWDGSQLIDSISIYELNTSGNVGIGTSSPSYELDVNGSIRGAIVSPSDARWKTNINTIDNSLEKVSKLRGVVYEWSDISKGTGDQIGVIAQEVEKIFPEVVSTDNDGYKSVAYAELIAPLIEAVKELKAENEKLKERIVILEEIQDNSHK